LLEYPFRDGPSIGRAILRDGRATMRASQLMEAVYRRHFDVHQFAPGFFEDSGPTGAALCDRPRRPKANSQLLKQALPRGPFPPRSWRTLATAREVWRTGVSGADLYRSWLAPRQPPPAAH